MTVDSPGCLCVVCRGNLSKESVNVKEMMFGTGELFTYRQCEDCGSLQIERLPEDMAKYYPPDYYSYQVTKGVVDRIGERSQRFVYALGKVPPFYRLTRHLLGFLLDRTIEWKAIGFLSPPLTSRILDVGCGSGRLLKTLRFLGYTNLVGIDPYLGAVPDERGLRLLRMGIEDVDDEFDIIVFNHSLEHIPLPRNILAKAHSLLANDGIVVLRTPVAQTHAWSRYRENWVQLDAPRHLFVPSVLGLEKLSVACGFRLATVIHDSTEFQFWGSEQYARGVPLMSRSSYGVNPEGSLFTSRQIELFRRKALELNECGQGDQVTAILEKTALTPVRLT